MRLRRREVLTLITLPSTAADAWRPEVLTDVQARTIDVLSELILPRTDTPGASDAKVNRYIDRMLKDGMTAADRRELLSGLDWIEARAGGSFLALPEEKQIALLTAMSRGEDGEAGLTLFRRIKDLTLRGYYTSREGLLGELEYKGNGVYTAYPGCTHTEHQK
jgi:hypothetical protein